MIPAVSTPVDERPPPPRATWQAGTLRYTTGGLVIVFVWLLCGDFALNLRDRGVPPVMQVLFKKFGASDLMTGLVFSTLPAALGLLIGPVVGYKSDRLRTRWGRRIPFLLVPIPFIVFSVLGLAFSPQLGEGLYRLIGKDSFSRNACVVLSLAVFWTVFDICCLVGNSVFGALVNDVVPQEVIGRFYGFFRAIGLIAGIIFFFKGIGAAEAHASWIFLGIGLIYGGGFFLMCMNVKEGTYPPVNVADPSRKSVAATLRTYFKEAFGNSYYRWCFGAGLLGGLCTTPINIYSLFYAQSVGLSVDAYGKCIALSYACSFCLSYPLGALCDRFHPLRVTIALLTLYAAVMACGGLLANTPTEFAAFFIIHNVVSGSLFTAWASLPQRLLPRAKFAEMNSAAGIIGALGTMAVVPLLGVILDAAHHNYRLTFYMCTVLTVAALATYLYVHVRFMALGGPENYVAPE